VLKLLSCKNDDFIYYLIPKVGEKNEIKRIINLNKGNEFLLIDHEQQKTEDERNLSSFSSFHIINMFQ
jgi:hypothetical protein